MRVLFMCVLRKKDRAKTVFVFVCVCGMWIHVHCASERTHDYANAVFRTGDYLGKFIRRKTKMEATLKRAEKIVEALLYEDAHAHSQSISRSQH